jgi:ATP-dependent HslUV protease subunit HslV
LEALMIVANNEEIVSTVGNGDVIDPMKGSSHWQWRHLRTKRGDRAVAPHRMNARDIAENALRIAASICIYTNDNIAVET